MSPTRRDLTGTGPVARTAYRLARREPSSLAVAVVGAIVVAGLFLGLGLVTARSNARADDRSFRLAVAEDQVGAERFLARLHESERFGVRRFPDAADAVIDGKAAIGLVLPSDTDERIAAGDDLGLEVLVRERHDVSLDAFGQLWAEIDAVRAEELERRGAAPAAISLVQVEVSEDERANQVRLAAAVAAMVCFLCVRLVGSTATVLGRAGDARSNEVLLLLPLDRRAVAAGIAAGTAPLHALHLLVALAVVLGASVLPLPTLGLQWSTVAAMVPPAAAGALLLGSLAAAVGALAGSLGAGGDDTISVGDLLALPFVAVAVLLLLVTADVTAALGAFAIPVLGQALVIRDGVVGSLTAAELAVATAGTAVSLWLAVTVAARALGRERKVVRVTW